jgi:hypothetical protein
MLARNSDIIEKGFGPFNLSSRYYYVHGILAPLGRRVHSEWHSLEHVESVLSCKP